MLFKGDQKDLLKYLELRFIFIIGNRSRKTCTLCSTANQFQ